MEWTPWGCVRGVQKEKGEETGRRVDANAASRIVESCGIDAIEKCERRPKSQILINRTPGEIGGGVQSFCNQKNRRHREM